MARIILLLASLLVGAPALGADEPETVYRKMHAAAVARDVEAMRAYAAQAQRADLVVPDVPRTYRLTGKAMRADGNAAELRASGTADSVGLGYTQLFGVVDLVKEDGEWKVERLSWSTLRPGAYPDGYVIVQGPAPEPPPSAESQRPRFTVPPSPPEPSRIVPPKPPVEIEQPGISIRRSAPECVIKPVMTDDELRACGARLPE